MGFRVYDENGNDVTDQKDWYINPAGELVYDIGCEDTMMEADGYWYET